LVSFPRSFKKQYVQHFYSVHRPQGENPEAFFDRTRADKRQRCEPDKGVTRMLMAAPAISANAGTMIIALLLLATIVAKVGTASSLDTIKQELYQLEQVLLGVQGRLNAVQEHRKAVEDTLAFFERRKQDLAEAIDELAEEYVTLEETERKRQETLSYDVDEEDPLELRPPADNQE
jgi:septal ring factor EnvC (AmiA/AmiB activator)